MKTRYSFGGDEHIFVEVDEEMSLDAFFKAISITGALREMNLAGVTEICPANASFQVKYDPDVIAPDKMLEELKALESKAEFWPVSQVNTKSPDSIRLSRRRSSMLQAWSPTATT